LCFFRSTSSSNSNAGTMSYIFGYPLLAGVWIELSGQSPKGIWPLPPPF
jgi:hypothetical protein